MNKHLLYSAMLVAAVSANEAKAQVSAPAFPSPVQLKLDGKDTVYVYNVKAQKWLNKGNSWGTQTSLQDEGMGIVFVPNKSAKGTYQMVNNSNGKWERKVFYNGTDDNGGSSYVDYNGQGIERCNWEVYLKDNGTFELRADSVKYGEETKGTRAGWNPNDAQKTIQISGNNEAEPTGGFFRPVLNMSNADAADYGIEWMAISPADYEAYNYRVNSLMPAINEAIEAGANVDKSITTYNNSKATLDELKEAYQYAKDMSRNKALEGASSQDVKDVTKYITNADCNSMTGWTKNTTVFDNDGNVGSGGHGFDWKVGSGTYTTQADGHTTDKFIERWVHKNSIYDSNDKNKQETNAGHLSDGVVSQTLTNLPAGGYKLTCYANANQQGKQEADATYRVDGAYFFATSNGEEKNVKVATALKSPQKYELYLTLEEGADLTFGMKLENTTANWVFMDDVTLEYYGSDALVMSIEAAKKQAEEKVDAVGSMAICPDYADAVQTLSERAQEFDPTSTTQEDVDNFLKELNDAVDAAEKNKALYEELQSLSDDLTELTNNSKYDNEALIAAYNDDGNNESYEDLMGSFSLNSEDLQAYITKLKDLMDTTRKSAIKLDTDVTSDMLTNPAFEAIKGWNNTGGSYSSTYQNCEAYQGTFNVYQDVQDIPNGVYEISVQAMHRIASNDVASPLYPSDVDEITAYVYGNDFTAKFASPYSYGMSEQKVTSGNADYEYNGKWIPNSMQGFAEACNESEDAYKSTVYALVTDGTLRVGVKEEARPAGRSSDWAIWDNFKIFFRGTSAEALAKCTGPLVEQANALTESKMNGDVFTTLKDAIEAVQSGATMDNIAALSKAVVDAKASIKIYEPLSAAIKEVQSRYEDNEKEAVTSEAAKAIYKAGLKTAEDACDNGTVANTEEAVNEAVKALNASFTKYFVYDAIATAQENVPTDISKVIINHDFASMDGTGWTITVKQNAAGGFQPGNNVKAVEFYDNKVFDISQELVGMPAGTYQLSTRAYYRKSSNINTEDPVNTYVYFAATADKSDKVKQEIKPIYAGPVAEADLTSIGVMSTESGLTKYEDAYLPNNMATGQAFLSSDLVGAKYDSEVLTFTYDGTSPFIIGVANDAQVGNDWTFIKSIDLKYVKGDASGIHGVNGEKASDVVATEIFDASGVKTNALKKGVNIVKTTLSDGSVKVRKVVVK